MGVGPFKKFLVWGVSQSFPGKGYIQEKFGDSCLKYLSSALVLQNFEGFVSLFLTSRAGTGELTGNPVSWQIL